PGVRLPAETAWRLRPHGPGIARRILAGQDLNSRIISLICLFAGRQFHYNTVVKPDQFFGVTHTRRLVSNTVENLLRSLPDGVTELMCHPGYVSADLAGVRTRLREQRERELNALKDPHVLAVVRECHVALINYRDLASMRDGGRVKR